mmetsp:Transcript_32368/g.63719  ORF Transcript_32368/g.63719 Transcript_32368/m.63719 type:complete len:230 (-) Transcript_32368:355-1044(-)
MQKLVQSLALEALRHFFATQDHCRVLGWRACHSLDRWRQAPSITDDLMRRFHPPSCHYSFFFSASSSSSEQLCPVLSLPFSLLRRPLLSAPPRSCPRQTSSSLPLFAPPSRPPQPSSFLPLFAPPPPCPPQPPSSLPLFAPPPPHYPQPPSSLPLSALPASPHRPPWPQLARPLPNLVLLKPPSLQPTPSRRRRRRRRRMLEGHQDSQVCRCLNQLSPAAVFCLRRLPL